MTLDRSGVASEALELISVFSVSVGLWAAGLSRCRMLLRVAAPQGRGDHRLPRLGAEMELWEKPPTASRWIEPSKGDLGAGSRARREDEKGKALMAETTVVCTVDVRHRLPRDRRGPAQGQEVA